MSKQEALVAHAVTFKPHEKSPEDKGEAEKEQERKNRRGNRGRARSSQAGKLPHLQNLRDSSQ